MTIWTRLHGARIDFANGSASFAQEVKKSLRTLARLWLDLFMSLEVLFFGSGSGCAMTRR